MYIIQFTRRTSVRLLSQSQSICPRRCQRRDCIRVTAPWSHHANLTASPLVACKTASTVQDRCPGLPVSKRPGTVVLGRWL